MKTDINPSDCDYEGTPFIRTVLGEQLKKKSGDGSTLQAVGFVMPVYGWDPPSIPRPPHLTPPSQEQERENRRSTERCGVRHQQQQP